MWDILFFAVLLGGMLVPSAVFKQWRLFWVFVVFFLIFGALEWLCISQTGTSISQQFWQLDTANPKAGWIIVIGMGVGWFALLLHFKLHKKK